MLITFAKEADLFTQATAAHRQGNLPDAEALYRQVLMRNPNHADALHMLGLLAHQAGNQAVAIELIERALVIAPHAAAAHSNLAEIKRTGGRLKEAEDLARRAIALDPAMGAAHVNLAMALHQQGRHAEALTFALRATELSPNEAPPFGTAGACLIELQRYADAVRYLEEGHRRAPNDAGILSTLGTCLTRLEQYDRAHAALLRAVELAPDHAGILLNMGAMFAQVERFTEAEKWVEKAYVKDPSSPVALEFLAGAKLGAKKFDECIELCRKILAARPDALEIYATMGEALMNLGRFEECITEMSNALAIRPFPSGYQALSNAHVRCGRPEVGLTIVDKAIAMDPNSAILHFNKSVILMLMGRLAEAWEEYEWRWKHPRMVGRNRAFKVPQWDGSPLEGKRILLHAEQGMGDTIFFGRYATRVAQEMGGKPVMWVQNSVVDLVKSIEGVAEVVGETSPLPAFDVHLPIMSLPRIFKTTLENIPAKVPYIKTNAAKSAFWKQKLGEMTGKFKVGLVWEGGPFQPENFLRSNSLAAYAPLAEVPGVAFFGLQKGPAEAQCATPPAGMDFTNLGPEIKDFSDTAAILENLDLLISIDTSVVHVAGALGKPVWMLLAWSPGHMWMFDRLDTPWYPTFRIFRQPAFKDWATPVGQVKAELEKLLRGRGT